ncbi:MULTISPECIES: amino acid ABC transporter ATP-binding protein [unclassified Romboutsia]|uniref:amino acid ABC transporter ATP-binding protein n=1 Tax=unclassified Romboutsia TaxID=2626894 RepID=UPI000821333B|nr:MULTISPECIES: amino acid ABC transporter ATP-binding protein [unclassified Romboutsia]SCH65008.1 L-cystine import ATP-binding protein TcyC [uncultured Clostridium sp.]
MLEIKNLNKSFENNNVLRDISFRLEKGEVGVLLGKSGAGKTTLLRCINGLEEFDSGKIIIDGEVMNDSKDIHNQKGKIGMVFQNFNLFPHMSVLQNIIEAPIGILKVPKKEAINKANELLQLVGLEDRGDFYPYQLSGGQQQRVAIARACALMPKILCFDEPTSALDKETTKNIVNIMKTLKSQGMTILIITHDTNFADEVADNTINISNGIIEYSKEVS